MKTILNWLFSSPKEEGGISDIMREVPHIEPQINPMEDLPHMTPLHVYGLHGQGKFRRDLAKEQKKTYRSVQDWASEQVRRNQ